jgi:cytochrome c553
MKRPGLILGVILTTAVLAGLTGACTVEDAASRRPKAAKRKVTDPVTGAELPDYNDPRVKEQEAHPDVLEGLATGAAQNSALCARAGEMAEGNPNFNAVTNAVCKEQKSFNSLKDLQAALGIDFKKTDARGTNGSNNNPGFAFLAHSSSLVSRSVSAINPRVFVFSPAPGAPTRLPAFVVMGFARGDGFVEIAAEQAAPPQGTNGKISFYLFKYDLACDQSHSCTNGDTLTPAAEKDWKGFSVYDDEDLKNTLVDCRHCHQPDGPSTPMMLRMQELEDPWTHWFRSDRPGGITLLQDFFRAHGNAEDYGGVPGPLIQKSDGRALEDIVKGQGFTKQPNGFNSKVIEAEVEASERAQPEINTTPGQSSTWEGLFQNSFLGNAIPVPYHDVKVTDPDKLQFATDEYKKFMSGQAGELADIRRVFLDAALEPMTMLPKSGASGREVLVQTCAQCHNPKLDQTISRAQFDVTKLDTMSAKEKQVAIQRLSLGSGNRLRMPPVFMRTLPDDARQAAIAELSK